MDPVLSSIILLIKHLDHQQLACCSFCTLFVCFCFVVSIFEGLLSSTLHTPWVCEEVSPQTARTVPRRWEGLAQSFIPLRSVACEACTLRLLGLKAAGWSCVTVLPARGPTARACSPLLRGAISGYQPA